MFPSVHLFGFILSARSFETQTGLSHHICSKHKICVVTFSHRGFGGRSVLLLAVCLFAYVRLLLSLCKTTAMAHSLGITEPH